MITDVTHNTRFSRDLKLPPNTVVITGSIIVHVSCTQGRSCERQNLQMSLSSELTLLYHHPSYTTKFKFTHTPDSISFFAHERIPNLAKKRSSSDPGKNTANYRFRAASVPQKPPIDYFRKMARRGQPLTPREVYLQLDK